MLFVRRIQEANCSPQNITFCGRASGRGQDGTASFKIWDLLPMFQNGWSEWMKSESLCLINMLAHRERGNCRTTHWRIRQWRTDFARYELSNVGATEACTHVQ